MHKAWERRMKGCCEGNWLTAILYMMHIIVTAMLYMLQILVLNSVAVSGRTHGFSSRNTGCKNLIANSKLLLLLLVL